MKTIIVFTSITLFNFIQPELIIEFDEFNIKFIDVAAWGNNSNECSLVDSDTIILDLDLASSVEGKLLEVSDNAQVLKIEQRFETSITLMNEGPHLDLVNWKHYVSEWKQISRLNDGRHVTNIYTQEEATRFPNVSMKEVYDQVEKTGHERWLALAKTSSSIYEYPFAVGISRYYFRITTADNEQKIIVFDKPMGC